MDELKLTAVNHKLHKAIEDAKKLRTDLDQRIAEVSKLLNQAEQKRKTKLDVVSPE